MSNDGRLNREEIVEILRLRDEHKKLKRKVMIKSFIDGVKKANLGIPKKRKPKFSKTFIKKMNNINKNLRKVK